MTPIEDVDPTSIWTVPYGVCWYCQQPAMIPGAQPGRDYIFLPFIVETVAHPQCRDESRRQVSGPCPQCLAGAHHAQPVMFRREWPLGTAVCFCRVRAPGFAECEAADEDADDAEGDA